MRYQQLMILVALATFAAVSTAAAAFLTLLWPRLAASFRQLSAVTGARLLVVLRLAPVALAVLACVMALLAFLRHEPRATVETPGQILIAGAAAGLGLAVMGSWRLIVRCRATARFLREVTRSATRVPVPGAPLPAWQLDVAFPLVALAGIWRPRVLIARCVVEQIRDDELQLILKHELAHARRRDNLVRLLLTGLPDVLSLVQQRVGIERAWQQTAEEAADDLATGDDAQRRVCLASGLVRVAKMAGRQAAPAVPLFAFHEGESVERRVRRLLDEAQPRSDTSAPTRPHDGRSCVSSLGAVAEAGPRSARPAPCHGVAGERAGVSDSHSTLPAVDRRADRNPLGQRHRVGAVLTPAERGLGEVEVRCIQRRADRGEHQLVYTPGLIAESSRPVSFCTDSPGRKRRHCERDASGSQAERTRDLLDVFIAAGDPHSIPSASTPAPRSRS